MIAVRKVKINKIPKIAALILFPAMLFLCGCTGARMGVGLPRALIYKNTYAPMSIKKVFDPRATGVKIPEKMNRGTATAYKIDLSLPGLWYTRPLSVGWGDASIQKAFENGNIKELIIADGHEVQILGIFTKAEIIVYGEPEDTTR